MVKRHSIPTNYDGCEICITTERMKDGKWSVVANVENHVGDGVQTTPMPVTHERFDTEEDARAFGMAQANDYLARATPAA
ncbi:MAG TPA: hypothetical protein VEA38_25355 [Terriglobales bacterium]|nr:hypothetical protein [Terriglobales bacterium]